MVGSASNAGNATIGTSAAAIVPHRPHRTALIVQNLHASNDLYLGPTSSVSTSNGIELAAGQSLSVPTRGAVYGIASGASTDVRFWEVY